VEGMIQTMLVLTMTLTAYTDCDPGMRCDGITKSGLETREGFCACGELYEFGTFFIVPDLGRSFVCFDRGSSVGDRSLDIWMANREEALAFGVQIHHVEVYPWVSRWLFPLGMD
jgi:rare lipoprotein A